MAKEGRVKTRVVLQQCLSARLEVQPASEDSESKYIEIGRGMIIYVCFLKDATTETVDKIVKLALNMQLSETADGNRVSVLDLPGSILIIPQATLGGSPKGKRMQYHQNIGKEEGSVLYQEFIDKCKRTAEEHSVIGSAQCDVKAGTYGNRQVFSTVTNGPYTHVLEL